MIKRRKCLMAILVLFLLTGGRTTGNAQEMRLYDLNRGETYSHDRAVRQLQSVRFVLVGEHHNNARHHEAQLQVIRALYQAGHQVAIGLEMFRRDSQAQLDQWIAGEMSEAQFMPVYLDNWNYGWDLYGPIFAYAREHRIPMVGLNVSRRITAQVAYHGFVSLSDEQKGRLENITCNVTPEYRDFIHRAYGAHGHGQMNFNRFCEAQLVWDTSMALNALIHIEKHPDRIMVILAGSGHARKLGIPTQISTLNPQPYAVVLPETPGVFDAKSITVQDADYLLLAD